MGDRRNNKATIGDHADRDLCRSFDGPGKRLLEEPLDQFRDVSATTNTGVAPTGEQNGGDFTKEKKQEGSISLSRDGSRLSHSVIASVEQLRTMLDLMIDEQVAELLEKRNRLPRFDDDAKFGFEGIDRQLGQCTNRRIQSGKLVDEVVKELDALRDHEVFYCSDPPTKNSPHFSQRTSPV